MQGKMLSKQMESRTRNVMVKRRKSGYLQKFRHNISLNDFGVPGECMNWCKKHSKGHWGWWFKTCPEWDEPFVDPYDPEYHEKNEAFMSFQYKRDALRFWFWWQKNLKELQS